MYTKYESVYYYKNPEIQLVINLQRIKDELGALLQIDHCDRCMGLKCKCLDVAIVVDTDKSSLENTTEQKDATTKDASFKTKNAKFWMRDGKTDASLPWTNAAKETRTTTSWTKDTTKWSFKFSPLNIEEDIWKRADRYRRLEEKYLSSETVEEFFLSLRKRAIKCS